MKRIAALVVLCLVAGTGTAATFEGASPTEPDPSGAEPPTDAPPAESEAESPADPPDAPEAGPDTGGSFAPYTVRVDGSALAALAEAGVDREQLSPTTAPDGSTSAEVVLSPRQAASLTQQGVALQPNQVDPAASPAPAPGTGVFRPYGGDGGIQEEFAQLAADHRDITKLVTIGQSVQGEDIVALKVTQRARTTRDGRRPAVLYMATEHAREWITPEVVRRMAHHLVEGYGQDPALTDLVNTTELWLVPVVNPDGYDHTFTPGNRYWRKNLRDNDGDGRITFVDGVDLNRNFPTRWGYDNEGSSPDPAGDTYRGASAGSEPETQAIDRLMERVGFEFVIDHHSAGEELLYGTAWQTDTPTPDDVVYEALLGDDAAPAIPGFDPDRTSELYVFNGVATEHAHEAHGSLAVLAELSTCQTASAADPADAWEPAACPSTFDFPDDEALIAGEFAKDLPLMLAVAQSAHDPSRPVSVTGRSTPEFVVDSFEVSYGDPQTVAVTARRDQVFRRMNYRVNGGRTRWTLVREWEGGERYGDERDRYYAEFRGQVRGTRPGDSVEVWFEAGLGRHAVASDHFTYTVASDADADALIIASEDYTGVNPTYPAGTTAPRYADEYAAALDANGISHETWDVDAQGVPHPLGVLSHFDAVIWETGADRLVQDPEDQITDSIFGPLPDNAVAERQHGLTIAVRDYLNGGGKLVQAGENTQYFGTLARSLGAVYRGLDGAPDQDCVITSNPLGDCLQLPDDFAQYWLGVQHRAQFRNPSGIEGAGPAAGATAELGGPAVAENPLDEVGGFSLTSDALPPDQFPQFAAEATSHYRGAANPNPFGPVEGDRYAAALPAPASYQRLGRTIDLTGVTAAETPALAMQLSYSTLVTFHSAIVEVAPSGTDQWTTLRDLNGRTSTAPPTACQTEDLIAVHPFLAHYLTRGTPCGRTGTTGSWNAFNFESNGWIDARFDLSPYAGQSVDVKVSYISDPVSGGGKPGVGVFVDDTRVLLGGQVVEADGFEGATSVWTVEGPPPGSPPVPRGNFAITDTPIDLASSVQTADTVLFGFGLESLATPEERAAVLGRALDHLLG